MSQVDFDRGLRTLKEAVTALSFALGALSTVQPALDGEGPTSTKSFGQITSSSSSPREMQFAIRFEF